ncbi:hypothetical protein BaRGS_00021356 [Batillaria attramentaria]|uniref:Uncharacterized protein n=1 Tax=Batillaria attramentaria TaxID=370345 RepID=A0ABD0KJQ1_9CAEN
MKVELTPPLAPGSLPVPPLPGAPAPPTVGADLAQHPDFAAGAPDLGLPGTDLRARGGRVAFRDEVGGADDAEVGRPPDLLGGAGRDDGLHYQGVAAWVCGHPLLSQDSAS